MTTKANPPAHAAVVPSYAVSALQMISTPFARDLKERLSAALVLPPPAGTPAVSLSETEVDLLAKAVYRRLRASPPDMPGELDADLLNRIPIVDRLRALTREDDLPWIQSGISDQRIELSGLLLSLLQPFDRTSDVHSFLLRTWATSCAALRSHLLWRILDMPNLARSIKQEVLDFILREWEVFNFASAKFLASGTAAIEQVKQRINDPRFPSEKRWVYLCRVVEPETDKLGARQFLMENLECEDVFTREVARTLLDRFFP